MIEELRNIKKNQNIDIIENKSTEQDTNKSLTDYDISKPEELSNYFKEMNIKVLEDFELQELIGKGSESYVYKALYKKNKRTVACKIIQRENGKINKNENNISKKLINKNIITTYDTKILEKGELDIIMMEYTKYNLKNFQFKVLKIKYLSETLLCYLAYQLLNGLKYMHLCKICHFDLKPLNIIIDKFLNIKIIDFSVSLDYSRIKSKKIKLPFRGTNFYIPPEVINNETINVKDLNKIDLYSLGVILYNLAFGKYPYDLTSEDSKDYDKIYEKVKKEWKIEDKDHYYSSHFIDFLQKLLQKDINKRININEALNHYWIKGYEILFEEKEKTYNVNQFLIYLMTDYYKTYNDYINKKKNFFNFN